MPLFSFKKHWQHWLGHSVTNRLKVTVFALTFTLLTVAGSLNFAYLLSDTHQKATHELNEHVHDLGRNLTQSLDHLDDHLRLMAANPAVISAVLDAGNQETYLAPLLQRSQPRDTPPRNVCITDYKGKSLVCLRSPKEIFADAPWLKRTIAEHTTQAHVDLSRPNHPLLNIAYPVIYDSTGLTEGVVIGTYDLAELIFRTAGIKDHEFDHIHLMSQAGDLFATGNHDTTIHEAIGLEPRNAALAALQLRFGVGFSHASFFAPVYRLTVIYLLLAVVLSGFALWLIGRFTPLLTERLTALSVAASSISNDQPFTFDAQAAGEDEIAQLAHAFADMTRRLQESHASLEQEVAERTAELNQQRNILQSVMDAVPGAIFQFRLRLDGTSQIPFVSRALIALYGVSQESVRDDATPVFDRVHPDDLKAHLGSIHESARLLVPWQNEFRVVLPDGCERWLYGNALPQREPDGATLWHGIVSDITEHKNAELALAESEAYNKSLFAYSHIPLVILDPDTGRFLDCNDAAVNIYRMRNRLDVMGKTPLDVSAPVQYDGTPSAEAANSMVAEAKSKGFHIFEWRHQRPNGEQWDAEVRLMLFHHGGKQLFRFSLRDITEQKRSTAEIWHQANFDPLTGLANRSLLRDRLDRAFAQARRNQSKVGLLYLDLDGFKGINDTLGHAAGDDLLKQTASRLLSCVREEDTASRIGGDEFVLVVQDMASHEDSKRVAECALENFASAFQLGDTTSHITTSIGIAVFPDDATSADALLDCADRALYRSKRTGKNRYSFLTD